MNPLVSVLMPAYNAEKYIGEAIESITNQTFSDFEFIIINDGSTDKTEEIVKEYVNKDNRIIYVSNDKNLKISKTLNRGMDMAKGKYIARMDADDIAGSERLEKQVKYMEENPDCGVLGTCFMSFGENNEKEISNTRPTEDHDIKLHGLYCSPFSHPTVMMKKSAFDEHNLRYDSKYDGCEDFELWCRAKKFMKFHNLPEFLLRYRLHGDNISITSHNKQALLLNILYSKGFKEIIDEPFHVPLFTKLEFTLPEIKESFNVLGEIPLMKLKEDCPFTRQEISYACGMHMKNLLDRLNLPNNYLAIKENYNGAEDYELKNHAKTHNLPEALSKYCSHDKNKSFDKGAFDLECKNINMALKEIVDESFYIPIYEHPEAIAPNDIRESFRVISEIPLMLLKEDCPFTRSELAIFAMNQREYIFDTLLSQG